MNIEIVLAYVHTQEINALFSEYTNMLITNDSSFQNYLDIQHYEEEINHLEEKYGMPSGRFRGKNIGKLLIQKIITDAKEIGYSYMLLDTLPFLEKAIHIYKQFGFYIIDCYNNSPMITSIYMKLDL